MPGALWAVLASWVVGVCLGPGAAAVLRRAGVWRTRVERTETRSGARMSAHERRRIRRPTLLLTLACGLVCACVCAWFLLTPYARFWTGWPVLVALQGFGVASVLLVIADVTVLRVPRIILLPLSCVVPVLLGLSLALDAVGNSPRVSPQAGLDLIGGAAALFGCSLLAALLGRGAIGAGDVQLAPVLGAVLGFFGGWSAVWWGTLVAVALGAIVGVVLLVRGLSETALPFVPCMLAGVWVVLLLGV